MYARRLAERTGSVVCVDPLVRILEQLPTDPRLVAVQASDEDLASGSVPLLADRFEAILVKEAISEGERHGDWCPHLTFHDLQHTGNTLAAAKEVAWVARLREQIALTGSDATAARAAAAAARVLAAGADRDVSEVPTELRAHTQTLNALREIQLEQGQQMGESFASQQRRIGELEREMQGGFATMATGMAQITALLTEIRGSERDG